MNNTIHIVLPAAVVAAAAIVVLLVDMFTERKAVLAWVASAGLVAAAVVAVAQWATWTGGWAVWRVVTSGWSFTRVKTPQVGFNRMVAFDKYGVYLTVLFCIVGVLTIMLSDDYLRRHKTRPGEVYALLLLVVTGMIGMAVSTDIITLFISFELMSLPTYVLAGALRNDERSGEAAMKYFVNGAFSSAILLFGLALLYGVTGETNYAAIAAKLLVLGPRNGMLIVSLVLIATGFGFKIAAVPFHGWAPDVYEGAPTPVTAFMSVGIKAGAFAGIVRLFAAALTPAWDTWSNILIVLAVLTMVVGNVLALPQRNLKRMLAYSSIAHAGYLLLGVIAIGRVSVVGEPFSTQGPSAVLFYLAAYAFMNLGAFGILVMIRNRRPFAYTLDEIAGLGRTMPVAAIAMTLFMLSLTGIPPLAGFWGKFYLFTAVVDARLTWLAIVAVIMSAVSAFYYLRVVWYMYFREAEGEVPALEGSSLGVSTSLTVAVLGVVVVGLIPQALILASQSALQSALQAMFGG